MKLASDLRLVHVLKKKFGKKSDEVLHAMRCVSNSYTLTGRIEDKLNYDNKLLVLSKEILGNEHPKVLNTMNNLAVAYG